MGDNCELYYLDVGNIVWIIRMTVLEGEISNYIFERVDIYDKGADLVSEFGYELKPLSYVLNTENILTLDRLGYLVINTLQSESKYFISDILDEDLEVVEKWLIKVSIIEDSETDVDDGEELISRKLVFELIAKIEDPTKAMILGFEIAKLPALYLTEGQQRELKDNQKFEIDVMNRVKVAL